MTDASNGLFIHQSTGRRKACTGCVKAKRRCDLRLPACTRCTSRKISCQYGPVEKTTSVSTAEKGAAPPPHVTGSNTSDEVEAPLVQLPTPPAAYFDLDEFLLESFESSEINNPNVSQLSPLFPNLDPFISGLGDHDQPILYRQPNTPIITVLVNKQLLIFTFTHVRSYISSLLSTGETPFIHRLTTHSKLRPAFQDLISTAALYCSRTPTNSELIFRLIESRIDDLIASSMTWDIESSLLGVQALVMYQIMRLFDSNAVQRAKAEVQNTMLDCWTERLLHESANLPNHFLWDESPIQQHGRSAYTHWIFAESVRRTIMMSVFVRGLFTAMKTGYCDVIPSLSRLPVTDAGSLWRKREEDWWESTLGVEPRMMKYAEYVHEWEKGLVVDVDEFERTLLGVCKGQIRGNSARLENAVGIVDETRVF